MTERICSMPIQIAHAAGVVGQISKGKQHDRSKGPLGLVIVSGASAQTVLVVATDSVALFCAETFADHNLLSGETYVVTNAPAKSPTTEERKEPFFADLELWDGPGSAAVLADKAVSMFDSDQKPGSFDIARAERCMKALRYAGATVTAMESHAKATRWTAPNLYGPTKLCVLLAGVKVYEPTPVEEVETDG